MSYNTENYTEQGGDKTVIGGTLEIKEGAEVTGLPAASASTGGTVRKGAAVPDCEAATVEGVVSSLNALLASLRTAGIISN